jgi:hypothetical protein
MGGALAVCGYAMACPWITSIAEVPGMLRLDMVLVALLGAASATRWVRRRFPWWRWGAVAASGALLGVATVSPWVAVPWLVFPALVIGWSARRFENRRRRPSWRSAAVFGGAASRM